MDRFVVVDVRRLVHFVYNVTDDAGTSHSFGPCRSSAVTQIKLAVPGSCDLLKQAVSSDFELFWLTEVWMAMVIVGKYRGLEQSSFDQSIESLRPREDLRRYTIPKTKSGLHYLMQHSGRLNTRLLIITSTHSCGFCTKHGSLYSVLPRTILRTHDLQRGILVTYRFVAVTKVAQTRLEKNLDAQAANSDHRRRMACSGSGDRDVEVTPDC
jgi:hypothetical protein